MLEIDCGVFSLTFTQDNVLQRMAPGSQEVVHPSPEGAGPYAVSFGATTLLALVRRVRQLAQEIEAG